MRKLILVLLAVLMIPTLPIVAGKYGEKLSELGHKKRMKKAAKQDPAAKKLLHGHKKK